MAPTPNKGRKSISPLETCTECKAVIQQKDVTQHKAECSTSYPNWNWKNGFIKDNTLYGFIEVADIPSDRTEEEALQMVFISVDAMQMCGIALGEAVVLHFKDKCVVKLAWPSNKNITSVSLIRSAINLDQLNAQTKIQKLTNPVYLADEITLKYKGKYKLPPSNELTHFLKYFNEHKIVTTSNRITIRYYGRPYTFRIINIVSNEIKRSQSHDISLQMDKLHLNDDECSHQLFYKMLYTTNFKIQTDTSDTVRYHFRHELKNVGGYEKLIEDLKNAIDIGVDETYKYPNCEINKGILLYGPSGVGKTMIVEAILNERKENLVVVKLSSIYTMLSDKIEGILTKQFEEAKQSVPSIVYIEDLDILFRKENQNDHKSKLLLVLLINLLDEMYGLPIVVLATISRLEGIDNLLRKPGRLHKTLEVGIPTPDIRKQIIDKVLLQIEHDLSNDDIAHIAFVTHGYVGVDLKELCCEAIVNLKKRIERKSRVTNDDSESTEKLKLEDFTAALTLVRPSAMRGVSIEVSNVRWEDIGGQDEIKLKLKQALEWPLKYPEAFERFGIEPPRGVLLYGPPGCSKTMIAKACATESKMNFLLVRASELFSKWVGESEKAVREVFRKARQVAPSIIFIDEIETIGRGRSSNNEGSNVDEKVLSLILTELDGVTALGNVTVIGATNRPDKVDEALLRPERFDRVIYVPLPDANTREEIFKIKLKKVALENIDIKHLVEKTEGYSGAEIQLVCKEAVLNALKINIQTDKVTMKNFEEALTIVKPRISASLIQLYENFKL